MTPLLTGSIATRAHDAVAQIAERLAAQDIDADACGHVALFWAHAASLLGDARSDAAYERALARLLHQLGQTYATPGLLHGIAGDAWALCHIAEDCDDVLAQIDRVITSALPALDEWELIVGAAGVALYFVERLVQAPGTPTAAAGLAETLDE